MNELCTFDPIKLAEPVIQTIHVEGVGDVKYAPLTVKDYMELKDRLPENEKDALDIGLEMTYRMLAKAYPGLTKDHLLAWPPETLTEVSEALLALDDFRVKKPESGSG